MASPPPTRPSFPSRTHSLPSSRPSSGTSHYGSSSSRVKRRPQARPILERATSLRASSSLLESDGSDVDEGGGRQDFCRRYLSRKGGFESEEEDEAAGKTESSFARWGRGYFPFSSRPSSRSSSASSSSRPIQPIHSSRPRGPRTRSRSNSTSSLSSLHHRHSLLLSSSSPWSNHPGKASATLGLITPSFDVLSWSLSLPHPHPSSYPRFKNSHRILLKSHRMHRTSLSLRNRNISTTSSNLAAPSSTLPDYPSPAGSETTIRPSRPSSTHRHHSHPQSNFYSCSPPPFRSTIIPTFLSSRSSSRSYSSEAVDDLAAFNHHPTIPTSYSSYLRAGGSSPSSSTGERTPRASRAPSRQGSAGGGASWESSPTATRRRGGVAPSLSFTASTRASSVASMGSAGSPKDFFSGGGGGRLQSRSRVGREEVADDEEALSPSPSYLTFGSLRKEPGSSLGGSRAISSPGVKRRDGSLSRAGGVATRGGKAVRAVQQRPIWR